MKFTTKTRGSKRHPTSLRRTVESQLRVESLEGRLVLAASIDFGIRDGIVRITGTEASDVVVVEQQGRRLDVSLSTPDGDIRRNFPLRSVRGIRFDALGGDDRFTNESAVRSVVFGGEGNDTIRGGRGADSLFGGPGDDTIKGGAGNDRIHGDAGDDELEGGGGADQIHGGAGNDEILGDAGNDRLWGDDGNDWLDGGEGRDRLLGGRGLDYEDDFNDRFQDGDRDADGYCDDHDRPVDPGLLKPVVFDPDGLARISGTFVGEDDRTFYAFTATADQTLTVTLQPDASGRHAELELRDTTSGRELLDLEPRENGRTTGQVRLRAGNTYLIRVEADSRLPIDYTADLSLSDSPPAATPPMVGGEVVFNPAGQAQISGTSLDDDDVQFFSFTAPRSGVLTVQLLPGADGRFAELELKDVATRREILEIEPLERPGRTSGRVSVTAGRTYLIEVESSYERLPADFTVNLTLQGGTSAPPPVAPPMVGGSLVFDASARAQVSGTSLNDDDVRRFSFTAPRSGVLTVQLLPGADGRYVELYLRDLPSRRELLEFEPRERPWQTSGRVSVTAGRSYLIEVESSFERLPAAFTINLSIA